MEIIIILGACVLSFLTCVVVGIWLYHNEEEE